MINFYFDVMSSTKIEIVDWNCRNKKFYYRYRFFIQNVINFRDWIFFKCFRTRFFTTFFKMLNEIYYLNKTSFNTIDIRKTIQKMKCDERQRNTIRQIFFANLNFSANMLIFLISCNTLWSDRFFFCRVHSGFGDREHRRLMRKTREFVVSRNLQTRYLVAIYHLYCCFFSAV